jgi:hypothetical protein
MAQVSLGYQQTIANASLIDPLPNEYSIVVSPSEKYIALLSQSSVTIFDTANETMLWQFKMEARSVVFDLNDAFLFASNATSLVKISVKHGDGSIEAIIKSKE